MLGLMRQIANKIKPASGFSHAIHIALVVLLPALLFVFVRINFVELAVVLVLVSKWRIFAVKPRHWPAILRANAVDILVGVSVVIFMSHTDSQAVQLLWAVLYGLWMLYLKPRSTIFWIGVQALIAQFAGLMAVYSEWAVSSTLWLTILAGSVCYFAARHFLSAFDESMGRTIAYCWAYIAAAIAWLTGHWLIFYGSISQPTLILTVVGYGLATLYYLQHNDRLSVNTRRQVVVVMCAAVFFIILFSGRSNNVIR